MASREQMEDVYNYIDELWRLTFGENADFSCPLYDGDFSKSLEQAQEDKHQYILRSINFAPGDRILDIGCGWGAMLRAVEEGGGHAVGLTLSTKQAEACRRSGLEAYVLDWKNPEAETLGRFDGILCIGAFEHFCSAKEYLEGKQDHIYGAFFKLCYALLSEEGRLYLQTMFWGKNVPPYERVSVKAPKGSDEYILATIEKLFPDSCLPFSKEQLTRVSGAYFKLVSHKNGRLDYIHTLQEWSRLLWQLSIPKLRVILKMSARMLADKNFGYQLESVRKVYYAECFRRQLMDHERMVFEKL